MPCKNNLIVGTHNRKLHLMRTTRTHSLGVDTFVRMRSDKCRYLANVYIRNSCYV